MKIDELYNSLIVSIYLYMEGTKHVLEIAMDDIPKEDNVKEAKEAIDCLASTIKNMDIVMTEDNRNEIKVRNDSFDAENNSIFNLDSLILSVIITELYLELRDLNNSEICPEISKDDILVLKCGDKELKVPIWLFIVPADLVRHVMYYRTIEKINPIALYRMIVLAETLCTAIYNYDYRFELPSEALDIVGYSTIIRVKSRKDNDESHQISPESIWLCTEIIRRLNNRRIDMLSSICEVSDQIRAKRTVKPDDKFNEKEVK